MKPVTSLDAALIALQSLRRPGALQAMAHFGIRPERRLGVSIADLRKLARRIGKNHRLALDLWKTEIPDAMILASLIGDPERITSREMDSWVKKIPSWDVCDQACLNLFDRSPLVWEKIRKWSARNEEFVRRAGYVLMATRAVHDRSAPEADFLRLLPLIRRGAIDPRNFVWKSVSWALRQIGKRNGKLLREALREARAIERMDTKPSRRIASEVRRELGRVKRRPRQGTSPR